MMTRMLGGLGTALVLALAATTPALAQDAAAAADPVVDESMDAGSLTRDRVTIALGAVSTPSYEGSDNNNWIPAGFIQGTVGGGYAFSTRGLRLFFDVVKNDPGPVVDFQLGPVVGLTLDRVRRKTIDDVQVEALGDRKMGIDVGGYVGIGKTGVITSDYDKLTASVSYVRDVNNAHDSYIITPMLDYGTPLSPRAYVGLGFEANYVGGKYADYYFTVNPAGAAASGLPTFNADSGWKDWSVTAFLTHSITGDLLHGLGAFGGLRYSRLLNDAKDSPVTRVAGDRDQWFATAGLTYTF